MHKNTYDLNSLGNSPPIAGHRSGPWRPLREDLIATLQFYFNGIVSRKTECPHLQAFFYHCQQTDLVRRLLTLRGTHPRLHLLYVDVRLSLKLFSYYMRAWV